MTDNPEQTTSTPSRVWRNAYWLGAVLLLLVPLIAMQFTQEVNWDVADFAIFGGLLFVVGVTYELAARKTGNAAYKAAVGLALLAAFLLFWINGAVGIIGSENNDANMMFYVVLIIGAVGFALARFDPLKLSHAMSITALAQVLAFVIALIAGWGFTGLITVFFVALWLGSAQLFKKAAQDAKAQN